MRLTLKNFIPLVRFFTLTPDEFYKYVRPYEKVLGNIYEQVLQSHLNNEWQPRDIQVLPRRNTTKARLLRHNHIKEIKKRIYSKKSIRLFPTKDPYDMVLLEPEQYDDLCVDPTVIVFRITELNLIIGGYNPFKTKYSKISYLPSFKLKAEYSFMFKIDNIKKIEFISTLGTQDFSLRYDKIRPLNIFDFKFQDNYSKILYRKYFYRKILDCNSGNYNIEGLQVFKIIENFK
ncbi:6699_t:CDS:1 [Dentiscutata erythropus]|uniref:6699_t:CDS:1 n=1 Tax=Dentiscutata erythropus TaxID=1348616 RepID=A0A9N9NC10_9GLOM|nr:6699_t:CDS:1 [Dentiscutata erythropus]